MIAMIEATSMKTPKRKDVFIVGDDDSNDGGNQHEDM